MVKFLRWNKAKGKFTSDMVSKIHAEKVIHALTKKGEIIVQLISPEKVRVK